MLPYHSCSNSTPASCANSLCSARRPQCGWTRLQVSEGADAPENQATLLIQSKGAENLLRIPNTLSLRKNRAPQSVRERLGREIEVGKQHELGADLRPDVDRVCVRGDDHPLRPGGSGAGLHEPRAISLLYVDRRARGEDSSPGLYRCLCKPSHVGQRLDRSGAEIEQRTRIGAPYGSNVCV